MAPDPARGVGSRIRRHRACRQSVGPRPASARRSGRQGTRTCCVSREAGPRPHRVVGPTDDRSEMMFERWPVTLVTADRDVPAIGHLSACDSKALVEGRDPVSGIRERLVNDRVLGEPEGDYVLSGAVQGLVPSLCQFRQKRLHCMFESGHPSAVALPADAHGLVEGACRSRTRAAAEVHREGRTRAGVLQVLPAHPLRIDVLCRVGRLGAEQTHPRHALRSTGASGPWCGSRGPHLGLMMRL